MIPHVAPPIWPETKLGRFAGAIYKNRTDYLDDRDAFADVVSKCRVGLIGLADDTGVGLNGGRLGAREGPHAFRAALARYGVAMPLNDDPPYPHVLDCGDIIPGKTLTETHDRVTEAVVAIAELGLIPLGIGGGHDLTYPFVRAVADVHGPMDGVYLDAHLDVRDAEGSGMPFRRLIEGEHASRIWCIGADPLVNTSEHGAWFTSNGGTIVTVDQLRSVDGPSDPSRFIPDGPSFVSIDLDGMNGAFAPGVSAANPSGLTPWEAERLAQGAGESKHVRCFDVMELCPAHDQDERTARLAAHLVLRFLHGVARRDV